MKPLQILIVCALVVLMGGLLAYPAEPVAFVPAAAATAPGPAALDQLTLAEQPQGMNFFERRRYGLTISKLTPLVREVLREAKVDPCDNTALAAAVLELHIQNNPGMFDKPEAINWDTLLEFIERLLPLILKIIALFL